MLYCISINEISINEEGKHNILLTSMPDKAQSPLLQILLDGTAGCLLL